MSKTPGPTRPLTWKAWLLLVFCVAFLPPLAASGAEKVALVIGNADYANAPRLANPVNDAQDIGKALSGAGFEVVEIENAGRDRMAEAVRSFSQRMKGAKVALLYYAGHGMQMDGQNFLLPVDARIETSADARFASINLADVQEEMSGPGRANVIVLDACRNNPFAKALTGSGRAVGQRGLGRVEASGVGSLIVFSTQPDNVALDGAGRNSPFAAALAKNIAVPGLEVRQMISRVRAEVLAATDQKQVAWDNSSLVGDVYLAEAAPVPAKPESAPEPRERAAEPHGDAADCERLARREPAFASPEEIKDLRAHRDWSRAAAVCKAASQAAPQSAQLHSLLGHAYTRTKDYLNALRELSIAAEAGDIGAQFDLGVMFATGAGVVKDYQRAVDLLAKAASAGYPRAVTDLGSLYSNGWGVTEDDAKALALYEKGIELGDPFALSQAGVMCFNGKGTPRDYAAAEQYFLQAANLGDGYAMKFLAVLYEHGLVGPADAARASQLRLRAAEEDPESSTPQVVFPKATIRLSQHARPVRHIVTYRWRGGGSYNPAWQAAPGDTRCCPHNLLVCPLGRHWC